MEIYTLPDLPYDYAALEPHINGHILELHHDKHHAAYVKGANDTQERIAEARDKGDFSAIVGLEKTLAFNLSGHVLHSLYWQNMSPEGGDRPEGVLAEAIGEHFGSFEAFHGQLSAATTLVQGSGWGVLSYEPLSKRLIVEQVYDHHGNVAQGSVPLLAFDAWEHAYYLQYKNVRPDFVKAMWDVVNWQDVTARYTAAIAG
ncbi:superoxide dismutase [Phytomonospora endophytica]|uniref:Superoxide dismutase n=1 Tax=Phytomonospora endophytica TaxID=714109 RepID=A0A841F895_9ACTN|nr:superoxide dismutase [Phytomonospora endophytica]MBB6033291.1 Fe-Mn family superoxide dismutase [Phytomonospora endophytica]GIG65518.1 superoxide dismutase [Fe-Zn] 1 [Phytomonospora endophytica]